MNHGEEDDLGGDFADLPDFLCDNDEIDRMIEERAGAFNLTGTNIRNILYVSIVLLYFLRGGGVFTILHSL